jgi:DNA invertase Pin-like site-specific DNA recombinase
VGEVKAALKGRTYTVVKREKQMTKRAAVYARYSSEEQTGGESIEYQLEQCVDHITKQGWSLGEVFVDRAKSGTTTYRREEFKRMVALAKAKDRPFDVVVAWSTSRFGRNMDECAVNKAFLRKNDIEVQFVSQPLPEGHVGKLIEKIFEWTDELQSIQIGEYAF